MKFFSSPFVHRIRFPFLSAILTTGFLPLAHAEDPAPVSIRQLVAEIAANNPELKFYEAEIAAAKSAQRSAGALADPQLTLDAGHKRVRDATGALAGEGTAWSVSVT